MSKMCECAHHYFVHASSGRTGPDAVCHGYLGNATPGLVSDQDMTQPEARRILQAEELRWARDFNAERVRAHQKHGNTSMESEPVDSPARLAILTEEIGEVAREFNEARHRGDGLDLAALRKELVQCGAMVAAWVSAIDFVAASGTPR